MGLSCPARNSLAVWLQQIIILWGVSINRIDEILAPYVQKSYLKHLSIGKQWLEHDKAVVYATERTHKEVDDACQALEYEINTLFTSQG